MSSQLNDRVVRVDNSATNAFDLEGFDTTSTTQYPSGFGVGTAREVTTWVSLSQVTTIETAGGEQQFANWVYVDDGRQRQKPSFKNAKTMTMTMDWDPSLAWHTALKDADAANTVHVLRAVFPNGVRMYWSVYVGFDGEPSIVVNQNMQTTATFSLASPFSTRYDA